MSEGGGDIPKPQDMNPGQAFNIPQETPAQDVDQNPGQFLKEHAERPLEDYSLWFGDVITFGEKTDPNPKRSVIVDVKDPNDLDFTVLHISKKEDGKDMVTVGATSTQGVEQQFYVLDKWSIDKIKDSVRANFEHERNLAKSNSNLSEIDLEKRMKLLTLMEDRELKRVDTWALKQSRQVTQDDIREGKRKKV